MLTDRFILDILWLFNERNSPSNRRLPPFYFGLIKFSSNLPLLAKNHKVIGNKPVYPSKATKNNTKSENPRCLRVHEFKFKRLNLLSSKYNAIAPATEQIKCTHKVFTLAYLFL